MGHAGNHSDGYTETVERNLHQIYVSIKSRMCYVTIMYIHKLTFYSMLTFIKISLINGFELYTLYKLKTSHTNIK